jgi:hypothetical protein
LEAIQQISKPEYAIRRSSGINYKNTLTECFTKIIINIFSRFNLKANKLENVAEDREKADAE